MFRDLYIEGIKIHKDAAKIDGKENAEILKKQLEQ